MNSRPASPASPVAPRILVVEDDIGIRETVSEILTQEGYAVRTAPDGLTAWEGVKENPPDLILSDIRMPGQDGFSLLARLRESADLAGVPVIFLTALAGADELRRGMESGADDYLTKPFEPEVLVRAVRARLARRRAQELGVARFRESVAQMLPHELRTPLVSVLGFSELLLHESREAGPHGTLPADVVRERARCIQEAGRRLHELVQRYTLWVELNARRAELITQRAQWRRAQEIVALVDCTRAHAHERGRLKDLQIALQPATLAVPEGYLGAVLLQLVDNALKFSSPGQPVVVLGVQHSGGYLLTVHDSGRGFPAGGQERIGEFVQFERLRWEQQGVGLGLAIARRFAEIVGGELRIESPPGSGSTRVMLRVPLAAAS
jgi:DNA-binding response OmpR family regulator/two-component sensor histidine kinase